MELESNTCVKCIQYDIELQRANMKIKTMQIEVQTLRMKIQQLQKPKKSALKTVVNASRNTSEVQKTFAQTAYKKCVLCYKELVIPGMDQHLCLEHRKFIQCPYCLKAFITTNDLLNHMSVHKAALATDRKHKFYKCENCSITYSMKILLECHRMAHVMGNDANGIPTDHYFENLAIINPGKSNKSKNSGNIIVPSSSRSGFVSDPYPAAALAYDNLVSNLKSVLQKCE